jgi:2,4-diketo-3-deoxy-L-fuconate hydrolase
MTLRFASLHNRAHLVSDDGLMALDLEKASSGRFSANPMEAFARWGELREFAHSVQIYGNVGAVECAVQNLDAPAPRPAQIIAIGINYRQHAEEFGIAIPATPLTFTKFPSSVNAPNGDVRLVGDACDWEAEMVLVVGKGGRNISATDAWSALAGVCIGQDISDRELQMATVPPQFSLGKSRQGFAPFGPWIVDAESLENRDNLDIMCSVNGELMQSGSTSDMIFDVSNIVEYLSSIVELLPGDVIYTGTPNGVGNSRQPPRFLHVGDTVVSTLQDVGKITNHCI